MHVSPTTKYNKSSKDPTLMLLHIIFTINKVVIALLQYHLIDWKLHVRHLMDAISYNSHKYYASGTITIPVYV